MTTKPPEVVRTNTGTRRRPLTEGGQGRASVVYGYAAAVCKRRLTVARARGRGRALRPAGVPIDESVVEAIRDVRNDETPTNWVLVQYQDGDVKKPLVVSGTGTGGRDEIAEHLAPDAILYGLLRVTDVYEGIKNVKFVRVVHIGNDVKPMSKAKVSTHKGAIDDLFEPSHMIVNTTSAAEFPSKFKFNY